MPPATETPAPAATETPTRPPDDDLASQPTVKVVLGTDVLFRFGSAELAPPARARLRAVARRLRVAHAVRLFVAGHTDARGTRQRNRALSRRRAEAVAKVLRQALRAAQPDVSSEGLGESQPLACNRRGDGSDDWTARAYNRRVEIWTERPPTYLKLRCGSR